MFHCAAKAEDWGPPEEFERINVRGTENVRGGARDAGARRVVHVSTEAALMAGQPLVDVDDTPLRPTRRRFTRPPGQGGAGGASREWQRAGDRGHPASLVGKGDATLRPLVALVDSGQFRWIGGAHPRDHSRRQHRRGAVAGRDQGPAGGVYFVTDGDPVVFKDFVSTMIATQGVRTPDKTIPLGAAKALAAASEGAWRRLKRPGHPPLTRFAVWASGMECTIDISRARSDLGYRPVKDQATGLAEMRQATAA